MSACVQKVDVLCDVPDGATVGEYSQREREMKNSKDIGGEETGRLL